MIAVILRKAGLLAVSDKAFETVHCCGAEYGRAIPAAEALVAAVVVATLWQRGTFCGTEE